MNAPEGFTLAPGCVGYYVGEERAAGRHTVNAGWSEATGEFAVEVEIHGGELLTVDDAVSLAADIAAAVESTKAAAPFSYYDASLAKIRAAVNESAVTRSAIAAALGVSESKFGRKIAGDDTLTVSEMGNIAAVLGVRMSTLVA